VGALPSAEHGEELPAAETIRLKRDVTARSGDHVGALVVRRRW
jgi:hypothetical protein